MMNAGAVRTDGFYVRQILVLSPPGNSLLY